MYFILFIYFYVIIIFLNEIYCRIGFHLVCILFIYLFIYLYYYYFFNEIYCRIGFHLVCILTLHHTSHMSHAQWLPHWTAKEILDTTLRFHAFTVAHESFFDA